MSERQDGLKETDFTIGARHEAAMTGFRTPKSPPLGWSRSSCGRSADWLLPVCSLLHSSYDRVGLRCGSVAVVL